VPHVRVVPGAPARDPRPGTSGLTAVRRLHLAGLECWLTGGPDGTGDGAGPLIVLLHGFGAPGDDLVPLAAELALPPAVRLLFPAAPLALDQGFFESRAWWPIDWERRERALAKGHMLDLSEEEPEGLAEARAHVTALLAAAASELGAPAPSTVLGGFSQGAMLACEVALAEPLPLAGLCLLSPTLLARHRWGEAARERVGLPVFMSHGRNDPVLPFPMAERLRNLLTGAGLAVEWHPFDGGHGIAPALLGPLRAFLVRALAPGGGAGGKVP
jgi:phospholipase/carboxylesterase